MRRLAGLSLALVAGCRSILGIDDPILIDAPADSAPGLDAADAHDPIDARACFGSALTVCGESPAGNLEVAGAFDTDDTTSCAFVFALPNNGGDACVITGVHVTVDDTRATGGRALVIVAASELDVGGVLDLGSTSSQAGAGAEPFVCGTATVPAPHGQGAGGAGGASFGGAGGSGGAGDAGLGSGTAGAPATPTDSPHGGCNAARGGNASGSIGGGGGHGGGLVYLIAGSELVVSGQVLAGGGGGGGGDAGAGGGGGGAGGFIGLDAPVIGVSGTVFAGGGGGGGGGGSTSNGKTGASASPGSGARGGAGGGSGSATGGAGGDGGPGPVGSPAGGAGTTTSAAQCGGGGGGGGVGVIWTAGEVFGGGSIEPAPIAK